MPPVFQRLRLPLALILVLLCALASGIHFYGHTFRGLGPQALDSAQLGRNIFRGAGFSSDILPAGSLAGAANASNSRVFNPELGQGPLFPFFSAHFSPFWASATA